NVTDMSFMFENCKSLASLDLRNFDTSNVNDMGYMFDSCDNLASLDLRNFDTSNVTDMMYMFCDCICLTELNVSNFNTSNVTNMSWMFDGCKNLKTVYVGKGWNTSKVEKSEDMFANCPHLVGGKGTTFDSEVIDITRAKVDGGKENPGYLTTKK
ncbi:surface protein, partial [Bacteroidales bacterium KHT7]